jgi:CubicO group peptidase (beta-lactamase class C family)
VDLPLGLDDDHLGAAGALCGSGTGIVGRTGRRVVLVRDGSQTVRLARGSARLEPQRRMRVSDRFRIASLTKTYTATVVVQLAGEGKLALDDPVERWLPGVVPNGAAITLRMLLNHHTGHIISTVDNVARFYRALLFGRLLAPALLREVTTLTDRVGLGLIQGNAKRNARGTASPTSRRAVADEARGGRRRMGCRKEVPRASSSGTRTQLGLDPL